MRVLRKCKHSHSRTRPENKYKTWKSSQRQEQHTHKNALSIGKQCHICFCPRFLFGKDSLKCWWHHIFPSDGNWQKATAFNNSRANIFSSVCEADRPPGLAMCERPMMLFLVIMRTIRGSKLFYAMWGESPEERGGTQPGIAHREDTSVVTKRKAAHTPPLGTNQLLPQKPFQGCLLGIIWQTRGFKHHLGFLCFKGE